MGRRGGIMRPGEARSGSSKRGQPTDRGPRSEPAGALGPFAAERAHRPLTRRDVAGLLGGALERGELELHYQPQHHLASNAPTGAEAFLRWRSPVLGMMGAGEFLDIAEKSGSIVPIGHWVLNRACAQLRDWQREGLPLKRIAVNVAAVQVQSHSFMRIVSNALYDNGLEPPQLELEITETDPSLRRREVRQTLARLHGLGVRLVLQRFGAAESSLEILTHLPVDTIKVGGDLVRRTEGDFHTDVSPAALLEVICMMAKKLNKTVTADGVETERQRRITTIAGCSIGQGNHFASPCAASEIGTVMRAALQRAAVVKQSLSGEMIVRES
jgi:EAL domain-containing protein (putative c-di-GMP-specific phosphodiesterase class I)